MGTIKGGSNIVTDGLLLYLDAANPKSYLDPNTTWGDLTYYKNNGTLINGPTWSSENKGTIVFDGVDDYVVTDSIVGSTEFTICVWCKVNYDDSDDYGRIVEKGFNNEWSLTINKGLMNTKFNFQYYDNINIVISNTDVNPTKYQYVVCTIEDDGGLKTGSIYVDGVFDNSDTRDVTLIGNAEPITIGAQQNELGLSSLSGNIPLIQYYGRALTASEILQNYNETKTRFGL